MTASQMQQKTFHGAVKPDDFANALLAAFNHGNLRARKVGRGKDRIVQIASSQGAASGGRTAITVHLSEAGDGVHVRLGQQDWFGVAASLGITALTALRRPFALVGRLDDLAQDIASLQLTTRIWQTLADTAESLGASHDLSERLRSLTCEYCLTANPVGAPHCIACGAPLGPNQPITCGDCGYLVDPGTTQCPQCGAAIRKT